MNQQSLTIKLNDKKISCFSVLNRVTFFNRFLKNYLKHIFPNFLIKKSYKKGIFLGLRSCLNENLHSGSHRKIRFFVRKTEKVSKDKFSK